MAARAIILAAGASSRMGRCKAALPVVGSNETFLSRLIRTALAAQFSDIVVVTGADPRGVRDAWPDEDARVRFVHNERWAEGQLTSLVAGLDAPPGGHEAAMLFLVDTPLVAVATLQRLLHVWRATRAPIVRPARDAEHGHPVIFDRAVFDELRGADPSIGAKAVVNAHLPDVLNVAIDDPGAYFDVDTPDDFMRWLE